MMENLKPEEENTSKDMKKFFRQKKKINYTTVEGIRNLFILEKETKAVKDIILRDILNLSEHKQEENY